MNKEELLKEIMKLPKVETINPISAMNVINVDDLMSAVNRFDKVPDYNDLLKENQELKKQVEEYERLNKENGRGFMITSVKQYNIDELIRCEDNWNKLKEWLENNWIESQDIWFVKIINKMQELEQGSDKE